MNRRRFLAAGAALAALPALPRLGFANTSEMRIVRPQKAMARLLSAEYPETPVWAYGGRVPGEILRIPQGKPVHFRLENALDEATSVHWHGIRIENAMDGVAGFTQAPVEPGATFDYRFTAPDAGTYWYHSHHRSWEQVGRGLYGMLVVEETTPVAVDSDRPFIADDWRLKEDGTFFEDFGHPGDGSHGGRLGNWLTVNGESAPVLKARPGERIRLRCVNTANARIMAFAFEGLSPTVIALDGQPLAMPVPLTEALWLAPAQRADLAIDIPVDAAGTSFRVMETSNREAYQAAAVAVDGAPIRDAVRAEPLVLPANPLPTSLDLDNAIRATLLMEGGAMGMMAQAEFQGQMFDMRTLAMEKGQFWAFNGVAGRPVKPLLNAKSGRTVVVEMVNRTRWPHAMHLHGHHFRVIARDGKPVQDGPWRDTELMEADERTTIAFIADNPGKWLFHCHMLEHHMAGMATWVEVV